MSDHRLCVHFDPERPDDASWWREWIEGLPPALRVATTMGERRPLTGVATPYPDRNGLKSERRDQVAAGLGLARALVSEVATAATTVNRAVVFLSGRVLGRVDPTAGADSGIATAFGDWEAKVEALPPDEPEWERDGWCSVWAGKLPAEELEALLEEQYGDNDRPLSPFARALRIGFYDHDFLEYDRVDAPTDLVSVVRGLSFAPSFVDQISDKMRAKVVDTAVILYDTDFSQRPRNAARGRLFFVGSFPFESDVRIHRPKTANARPASGPEGRLFEAVAAGDLDRVRKLLNSGQDVAVVDHDGRGLLTAAVRAGHCEVARLLLERGAHVNAADDRGWTALHHAAAQWRTDLVDLLLSQPEVSVDIEDEHGNTALWRATFASQGRGEVIDRLLKAGADRDHKNKSGVSPFELANRIVSYPVARHFT